MTVITSGIEDEKSALQRQRDPKCLALPRTMIAPSRLPGRLPSPPMTTTANASMMIEDPIVGRMLTSGAAMMPAMPARTVSCCIGQGEHTLYVHAKDGEHLAVTIEAARSRRKAEPRLFHHQPYGECHQQADCNDNRTCRSENRHRRP